MLAAILGTVLVLVAVLVIVLESATGNGSPTSTLQRGSLGMQPAPSRLVNAISRTPPASFTAAGVATGSSGPFVGSLTVLKGQPPLTQDRKPLIVYVGANWCPYCAATRWPLAIALARFGTFEGLRITSSGRGPGEPDPGTNTLSFYGSTYTSRYVAFLPTEECTSVQSSARSKSVQECNGYEPLETLSGTALKIFEKYDFPPYVSSNYAGTIPFVDMGNKIIGNGAFVDPAILQGLSQLEIADRLADASATPSATILSAANYYTAGICELTDGRPGTVCRMSVVKQAAQQLRL